MERTLMISDSCIGCGQCAKVCIRGHLAIEGGRAVEIESPYSCFRCGHCGAVCPKGAIAMLDHLGEEQEAVSGCPVPPGALAELYRRRRSLRWFDRGCTREELEGLTAPLRYSPTAENSQAVQFAVVDEGFDDFMRLVASILKSHTHEHPRLAQFVDYVEGGMVGRNNPFTWEGRQLIIAFSRLPIDAIIAMEQLDLMAFSMGLGGFHSRWILQASENDPERFMSFFPEVGEGLSVYAVFVIGHPRIRFRRTVPRDDRPVLWKRILIRTRLVMNQLSDYRLWIGIGRSRPDPERDRVRAPAFRDAQGSRAELSVGLGLHGREYGLMDGHSPVLPAAEISPAPYARLRHHEVLPMAGHRVITVLW